MSDRVESLLEQQLQEMKQTNALLDQLIEINTTLIEALAQSDDVDPPALHYLNGSRVWAAHYHQATYQNGTGKAGTDGQP